MTTMLQTTFENVLDRILSSWTALELAINHYDGAVRVARSKRQELLETMCDAIMENKYEVNDIAEYIAEFMFEQFHMELDDNSSFEVAQAGMNAWSMVREGRIPQIASSSNGALASIVKELIEEVDASEDDDVNMVDESVEDTQRQSRVVVDEEGWSTIVPRNK